jgi:hypothetical protein
MSSARYALGFYIQEDSILHSHRLEVLILHDINWLGSVAET